MLTIYAYTSLFGPVEADTILAGLNIMLYGLIGIFIAMGLIYGVILILNTLFKDKKSDEESDLKG